MAENKLAVRAAEMLVAAYKKGRENGGSIAWEEMDFAYEMALKALKQQRPHNARSKGGA